MTIFCGVTLCFLVDLYSHLEKYTVFVTRENLSDVKTLDNCWCETVRPHCIQAALQFSTEIDISNRRKKIT